MVGDTISPGNQALSPICRSRQSPSQAESAKFVYKLFRKAGTPEWIDGAKFALRLAGLNFLERTDPLTAGYFCSAFSSTRLMCFTGTAMPVP